MRLNGTEAQQGSFDLEPNAPDESDRVRAGVIGEDSTVVELADRADALVQWHGGPTAGLHHRVGGGEICATEAHAGYFALDDSPQTDRSVCLLTVR
jgi:hypothetical protein